jgi:hypothetical protein
MSIFTFFERVDRGDKLSVTTEWRTPIFVGYTSMLQSIQITLRQDHINTFLENHLLGIA